MLIYWAAAQMANLEPPMRDDKYRDERESWSSDKQADGHVVDIDAAKLTSGRVAVGPRSNGEEGRLGPYAARFGDRQDDLSERVSRRRRFRPEALLVVIATVFIAGALLKPWTARVPASSSAPTGLASPSSIATATASGLTAAASTAHPGASPGATYPNIPPTDYTFPYFGSTPYFGSGSSAPSQALTTPVWSAVDWSVLGATDPHSGWGFTAALMPSPNANAASPTTNWVDAGSPPAYASVPLVRGRYAYAIAVTWPADLNVTGLTFVYLAPPRSPPYIPPAGFSPNAQVTPLPADSVSSPSATPAPIATIPPWFRNGSEAIPSGSFWIAPSEESPAGSSSSVNAAWQSDPWPWPYGSYLVTVTSDRGKTHIVLDLLLT
jgi:hypothetical protein